MRRSLGMNYEEAIDAFRAISSGRRQLGSSNLRVKEAIERWLETGVATARIASGRRDVAARIRRYTEPHMGERMLRDIRPDDLLALRVALEGDGLRPTLVHRVLSDTRSFFRWAALDARLIAEPPIPRRLLPRLQQRFPERLSDEEAGKASRIPDPYGFVIRFALATGLRWGELTRAQAADVRGGVLRVALTKSGKTRIVPLSEEMLNELRRRIGRLVPFTHPGMFARQVQRLSGVARFHMHLTRHTFACRWVEAGGNLAVLQAVLGHSSVLVTERYGRMSEAAIRREAARLDVEQAQNQAQRAHSEGPKSAVTVGARSK